MPRSTSRLAATLVAAITSGALVAGCASSSTDGASGPSSSRPPVPPAGTASSGSGSPVPQGAGALPAATVTDVTSGAPVELQSLRPADKPLLVWFWAPF